MCILDLLTLSVISKRLINIHTDNCVILLKIPIYLLSYINLIFKHLCCTIKFTLNKHYQSLDLLHSDYMLRLLNYIWYFKENFSFKRHDLLQVCLYLVYILHTLIQKMTKVPCVYYDD